MIDEILCSKSGGRVRIALREDGRLVDLIIAGAGAPDAMGSIVLGRVSAVLPGMEAAFVDIGAERAGFLSLTAPRGEAENGEGEDGAGDSGAVAFDPVHEGGEVLVQVTKTAQAGKGAGLTRSIGLAGRYLVLTPMQPRIAISRRIDDTETRAAIEETMGGITRPGEGFIVRTAGRDADARALADDADDLRRLWATIVEARRGASCPTVLHGADRGLGQALRDFAHEGVRRILVDDRGAEADAEAFCDAHMPDLGTRIETWGEADPMFEALGVEDEIAAALEPCVVLPCGGTLIIEETQALTAVDVNTGRHVGRSSHADTVRLTNLEAAAEVPRQLRLRGLGGITVIDFIHMDREADQEEVLATLMQGLAGDPGFIRAGGISELGLVELARRRGDGSLRQRLEALEGS
ncbi:MAG: Rne/Rng family ribonuclease [Alphaproteobacteria bacterium]|nr:Rne/Rng family ribonuclease [Alphaproteobacteria bacterium]